MKKKKKFHFLYHIKNVGFKMMTEQQAKDYKNKHGGGIWNVHKALDIEPDLLEVDEFTKQFIKLAEKKSNWKIVSQSDDLIIFQENNEYVVLNENCDCFGCTTMRHKCIDEL